MATKPTKAKKTVFRSSRSGRFVTKKTAARSPSTTEREQVALVLPAHKKKISKFGVLAPGFKAPAKRRRKPR